MSIVLMAVVSPSSAKVIYVDVNAPGPTQDGSSWTNAYNYLQDALANASSGDEIRVAQGIYKPDHGGGNTPGSRAATFRLINGVTLRGGYAGAGTPNPNARDIAAYETILSGDLADNDGPNFVNYGDNSYHIVTGNGTNSTAVLDGFTITGGNADAYQSNSGLNNTILIPPPLFDPKKWGGGMYNDSGSPTINNCTFSSNASRKGGATVYNKVSSSPTFSNCTFNGNHAGEYGGGIYSTGSCNPTLTDCTFRGNSAHSGGSMYNEGNPTLTNCLFIENSAGSRAGGIYNYNSSMTLTDCTFYANSAGSGGALAHSTLCSTVMTGCIFIGNSARNVGGAMYSTNTNTLTLTRCTLIGNSAGELGGAMFDHSGGVTLTNCRLSENSSVWGGGMYNDVYNNSTLANCTITNNRADKDGGGICLHGATTTVTNCILWDDTADEGNEMALFTRKFCHDGTCTFRPSQVTVSYSDVRGRAEGIFIDPNSTVNWWDGNIDADPCFVHSGYQEPNGVLIEGDYNLLPGSPCVNAGDPGYIPQPDEKDLDGKPRIVSGRIDMGAYESPYLGFLVSQKSITVPEGATATFTVMLSIDPLGTLEATVYRISGDPDISVESGALLTFDSSNYFQPQTVTLSAAEDEDYINNEASIWISASGFVVAVVSATEADNDPYPKTLHVDADAPGANNGSSWADAYNDLQDALSVAQTSDEILVAQGIYTPEGPLYRQTSNPNPPDNGPAPVSTTADLSWTAGAHATSHDVYFGTSSPGIFQGNQSGTTFDPGEMAAGTKYYWRIDEVGPYGTTTGTIWSFTTLSVPPPTGSNESLDNTVTVLDRTATFQLKNGVTIKGGYAGFGEQDPNARDIELYETILSGDLAGNDVEVEKPHYLHDHPNRAENSYHVVTGSGTDETAIVDGFSITGGKAEGSYPHYIGGGGMYSNSGSPMVTNCTFIRNSSFLFGGGMFNYNSSPTLANCTFNINDGGGMENDDSSPRLIQCVFNYNTGSGISNYNSDITVTNCIFTGNIGVRHGGGIYNDHSIATITNCTISENKAGGLYNWHNSSSILVNCILYDNTPDQINGDIPTVTYSNVQGGWAGLGNIDTDPCFVLPGYWDVNGTPGDQRDDFWVDGDYHLKSQAGRWDPNSQSWVKDDVTSPCIDAGNPGCPVGDEPAPNGNRINMGAYGGTAEASKSPAYWRSIADITNDWIVDSNDLKVFCDYWLQTGECIPGDLDRSRSVDSNDFAIFGGQWRQIGPGPGITYEVDECVPIEPLLSTSGEAEPTRFTVTVEGSNIGFEDLITANCCADEIELIMTVEEDLITIYEIEHLIGVPCPCICDYPITATLGPFEPDTYILEVYQDGSFIGSTNITIDPAQ
jgi:predicted outer membrane repeat protein